MFESSTISICTSQCSKFNMNKMITRRHRSVESSKSMILDFGKAERRASFPLRMREITDSIANNVIEKLGIKGSRGKQGTYKDEDALSERTKQLIIEDDGQWARFQNELRHDGITTNGAIQQRLSEYIDMREEEKHIDACLNALDQSKRILLRANSRFVQQA